MGGPYSLWDFSTDDIASVVGRLPDASYDAPLYDLAPAWKVYLQRNVLARSRYQRAIGALLRTGALAQRRILYAVPSLGFACYLEDELEQAFAALDFGARRLAFTIEVFWSDRGSCGGSVHAAAMASAHCERQRGTRAAAIETKLAG